MRDLAMTTIEFKQASAYLVGYGRSQDTFELAHEMGVPWQEISRANVSGATGALAAAMRFAIRLKRAGIPWRLGEVAIGIADGGQIVFLSDSQAAARLADA